MGGEWSASYWLRDSGRLMLKAFGTGHCIFKDSELVMQKSMARRWSAHPDWVQDIEEEEEKEEVGKYRRESGRLVDI